jgi:hypothetical protein
MSWHWTADLPVPEVGLEKTFPSQGEAESWIGERYPELMAAGIRAVSLYEEGRLVYGPMRLEPEIT